MRKFYKTLTKLRKKLPTSHPVLVYIVESEKMKGLWGDCYFTGKRYVIRIAKGNWETMRLILVHEYAHCLSPWKKKSKECHDEDWGIAYAKCWRVFTGE